MPTLILTEFCNRLCSFCFAPGKVVHHESSGIEFSLCSLRDAASLVQRSGFKEIALAGGEPTLHSQFSDVVDFLLSADLHVKIFSNGLIEQDTLDYLAALPKDMVLLVLNLRKLDSMPENEKHALRKTMEQLGEKIVPGYTIQSVDADPGFLIDYIKEFGLHSLIRLGIALPSKRGGSSFLEFKDYSAVGDNISAFAEIAQKNGISLSFDCGFVRCMFNGDPPESFKSVCVPVLDLWQDSSVTYCLPLTETYTALQADYDGLGKIAEYFNARALPFRKVGVSDKCLDCKWLENGECSGGCLAMVHRTFRSRVAGDES